MAKSSRKKSKTEIRGHFIVPVFANAEVFVVVSKDIKTTHNRMKFLEAWEPDENWDAVVSYNGMGQFAVFFRSDMTDINTIAHELFHLTHRIAEWCGIPFHTENHEPFALLQGYLAEKIMKILGR